MTHRTISTTVTTSVVLGSSGYGAKLTVTASGAVTPNAYGATAITAPNTLAHAHILNQGLVQGGVGAQSAQAGAGGIGVWIEDACHLANSGEIRGGTGGYGIYTGGTGGVGVVLDGGHFANANTVQGGNGGGAHYYYGTAGSGGVGVQLSGSASMVNTGTIGGGLGSAIYNEETGPAGNSGNGGAGVQISADALLVNAGSILGGSGGAYAPFGGDGFYYGAGGAGGAGVAFDGTNTLLNTGSIGGGDGGGGFYHPGTAGIGVDILAGGSLINRGTIAGGTGGDATYANSAAGAAGVALEGGGTLLNSGTIGGGTGGYSVFGHGGAGGAGVFLNGGTLTNAGTITGGGAGAGGYGAGKPGDAVQFGSTAATLVVDPGAVFQGNIVGNSAAADALVLASHGQGSLTGFGTTITGIKTISEADNAHWILNGVVGGQGSLMIGANALLAIAGTATIKTIAFAAGGAATLRMLSSGEVDGKLSGFAIGDTIDLRSIVADSLTYGAGTLTLFDAGTQVETLHFAGHYQAADFAVKSDGYGGTDIILTAAHAFGVATWDGGVSPHVHVPQY